MRNKVRWHVGISGWNYDDFNGLFYPKDLNSKKRLEFYSQKFNIVEINSSFYRIFKKDVFDNWAEKTPPEFKFTAKINRQFTHKGSLNSPENLCEWFFSSVAGLGEKLKVILIQLPPRLNFEGAVLDGFLQTIKIYTDKKLVLEPRNSTWFADDVYKILSKYSVAFCLSNTGGKYPEKAVRTADFTYTRLHGSGELYNSSYTVEKLKDYKEKIEKLKTGENYVFFDNTMHGYAVKNCIQFQELIN
ncbi:MAG: DUF72 domain-containing protein [Elusimicrobiota bacterium]